MLAASRSALPGTQNRGAVIRLIFSATLTKAQAFNNSRRIHLSDNGVARTRVSRQTRVANHCNSIRFIHTNPAG
jgi:hypothetical protein